MSFHLKSRAFAAALAVAVLPVGAFAADDIDLSPQQPGRIRAEKVQAAIDLIPKDFKFAEAGKLTVATNPWQLPFGVYATDNATAIGAEPDVAQIVADSLGLELNLIPVAWADWPLGLTSGKFDAVISNVTVTEERKEKFDFATYRQDLLGFYAPKDSKLEAIREPKDIAGLKVIVGSGTNQESILLNWIDQNKKAGLADTELVYFDDEAARDLALFSGRADAYLGPNAAEAFKNSKRHDRKLLGSLSGGYPLTAEIAAATRKGDALSPAIAAALNAQIQNGTYGKVLGKWGLTDEVVTESRVNPPGLPKK
ncbi:MAG: ABC transporter substrate-binding protein [Paracoccaceae bacterium]